MGPKQNTTQRAANTPPNHNTHQTIIRANEADRINNKHQNTGQIQTRKTHNDQINNKQQTITGQTQATKTHDRNINTQAQDNNEQETNKNQQEQQDKTAQSTTTYLDIIANLQNDINKSRNILEENTNHTNPDQNPSKQQQITLKRTIDNNEADEAIPKRINIQTPTEEEMMFEDILQSPGWPDDSTETSQTEEQIMETSQNEGQIMDLQNLLGIMTPITPIKTRSRSQEQERLTINTTRIKNNQDKNRSRSQEQKRQTKNTTERGNNKDKIHQTAIHRINKTAHKGKNQKPKINNKPKENKEQKQINGNKLDNELEIAISTPNK